MARLLILGTLLVAACGSPCEGEPGIRVHLRFIPWPGALVWGSAQEPLRVETTGGTLRIDFDPDRVDQDGTAEVRLAYPSGTRAGPARIWFYYAFGRPAQWQGETSFTADPSRCVDVDLDVNFVSFSPDAGVPAADAQVDR